MIKKLYIVFLAFMMVIPVVRLQAAQETDQKFQGFNLQGYTDSGEKSWEVNGDTANIDGTKVKLSNVVAHSYGEEKINMTAETGTIDQSNGQMQLNKDVIIVSESGTQLTTDSIEWQRENDLVTTEDEVQIIDEGMMMTGKGMDAHPGLKNATIKEDVTVRMDTERKGGDGKVVTITSDGPMTIDQGKSVATFEDNVVAIQQDKTLKADRMEVYFEADMSGIKQLICTGNVEILQGENKTFAEKAVYNAGEQKMILSGRPKMKMIIEGENAITAFGN
jgi:LPS export ABC transporter protein LptC/lipopolysaccharide transport protein LptA